MTSFDALLILLFAVSILFAAMRGAVREFSTLVAVGVAAVAAWAGFKPVLGLFGASGSFLAGAVVIAIIAAVAFVAVQIGLNLAIRRFDLKARIGRADRIVGGMFGFLRALVLVGLAYLGYGYYLDEASRPDTVRNAALLPLVQASANFIEGFAPSKQESKELTTSEGKPDRGGARYAREDRDGLGELVTTVTTGEAGASQPAPQSDEIAELLDSQNTEEPRGEKRR